MIKNAPRGCVYSRSRGCIAILITYNIIKLRERGKKYDM